MWPAKSDYINGWFYFPWSNKAAYYSTKNMNHLIYKDNRQQFDLYFHWTLPKHLSDISLKMAALIFFDCERKIRSKKAFE